jgi:hypothetical protein
MQGTSRSELAAELEQCARLAEDTAELYVDRYRDSVGADLVSALLLAAAALDTAGRMVEERSPARTTALMIARTLAGDAIEAGERRGLDEMLALCIARLRRVAALCDRELDV